MVDGTNHLPRSRAKMRAVAAKFRTDDWHECWLCGRLVPIDVRGRLDVHFPLGKRGVCPNGAMPSEVVS